jgi:dynein light intermediate chain 1
MRQTARLDTEDFVVQAYLQRYTEPSAEPLPATSTLSDTTLLPLGPGTLTHNTAGVPIIVTCTKADHIDDTSDGLGPGASGMGGMVKGKGGEWEEQTDTIMQVLRTICLKCEFCTSLFIQHS